MSLDSSTPIARALQAIAREDAPTEHLAVELKWAGGPMDVGDPWDTVVGYSRGHEEWFWRTMNMPQPEGGSVGHWRRPAEPATAQLLAQAMLAARIWLLESEDDATPPPDSGPFPGGLPPPPMMQEPRHRVIWAAGGEEAQLSFTTGSGLDRRLGPVIGELMELATRLVRSGQGAELACELELVEHSPDEAAARISLCNPGTVRGVTPNPLHRRGGRTNQLWLDARELPPDPDSYSGPGSLMQTPRPDFGALSPPWDGPYLVLEPGAKIACPVLFPIGTLDVSHGYSFMATCANLQVPADEPPAGGLPVRGVVHSQRLGLFP